MKTTGLGVAVTFAVGMVWLLAASPATALCQFQCTCFSSCEAVCETGPEIIDCPECNDSTCGEFGTCIGSWGCAEDECNNLSCTSTINGTSGPDTLNGTSARECINGLGGNDTIDGKAGDDRIHGNAGTDTCYGDSGNDCLWGDEDGDHLDGGSGYDFADGGTGTDTCYAEAEINCEL
jgi:Ca2+-binding RTX toxin-like protein